MSTIWSLQYSVLTVAGLKKPYSSNDPAGLVARGIAKPVRIGRRNTTIEVHLLSTDVTAAMRQALEALSEQGFVDHTQRVAITRRDDRTVQLRFEHQLPLHFDELDVLVERGQIMPSGHDPRMLVVGFYYVDHIDQTATVATIWEQLFTWGIVATEAVPTF